HYKNYVVILAKLGQILPPALLVILVRADQIAALCVVFEPGGGGMKRKGAKGQCHRQYQEGMAARPTDQANHEAVPARPPARLNRFRHHVLPSPLQVPWLASLRAAAVQSGADCRRAERFLQDEGFESSALVPTSPKRQRRLLDPRSLALRASKETRSQ